MFTNLLRKSPPELVTILNADRTLLSDDAFMSRYPEVASFVEKHPEIRRNPRFYLLEFEPRPHQTPFDQLVEMVSIGFVFLLIVTASAWLIRTVIEQRRWSRMSKLQAEVHAKILDRFSSSSEVLEYIKSPAGTKFLEAAPIPLQAESRTRMTPMTRVAWTIQLGVVIAAAGLGMLLVSLRLSGEGSDGMYSLGMIAFCLGAGFIASAAVSVFVSRRLGILQAPPEEVDAQ
jgi:hypothetical protein